MKILKCAMIAALATLAAACSDQTDSSQEKGLLDTHRQALEDSRDVQQQVLDAAQRQKEEMERAGEGES